MNVNSWTKDMDTNTAKYIVGLQQINKSLIKTLKIYGDLLRKSKFENEKHKVIGNIDKVIASANETESFARDHSTLDIRC